MVANGLQPEEFDFDQMIELLDSAAEDVVMAARIRKGGKQ
ncbi:hypothetical protein J15TS10_36710 [Paenibacillus woosongensis]|uniref:Uncharacterized protein n=2 Tax=Paenibacillus woosongensis TaxID=307580 RepID=A0ABQ4MV97_9BACL|nr:hypothetical protein J15TS10_36710 [Paenibacillus woosongensis]